MYLPKVSPTPRQFQLHRVCLSLNRFQVFQVSPKRFGHFFESEATPYQKSLCLACSSTFKKRHFLSLKRNKIQILIKGRHLGQFWMVFKTCKTFAQSRGYIMQAVQLCERKQYFWRDYWKNCKFFYIKKRCTATAAIEYLHS